MADAENVPGSQAEFDALTEAQLSDVAETGRRIERAHRVRLIPAGRPRLRLVKGGGFQPDRHPRGPRVPVVVQYLIALLLVVAAVVCSLVFSTRHDPPHSAPVVRPDVVIASDRLFPAHVTGGTGTGYQRVATSTSQTCAQGPGVPQALADAVAQAGGCAAIQLALYTDTGGQMRVTVGVITMQQVAEMQQVDDAILRSGGAMMVGMLPPPSSARLPDLTDGTQRPAYVTPTGSAIIVGVGEWAATGSPNADTLRLGITEVMGTVTQALVDGQPAVTVSRPNR